MDVIYGDPQRTNERVDTVTRSVDGLRDATATLNVSSQAQVPAVQVPLVHCQLVVHAWPFGARR